MRHRTALRRAFLALFLLVSGATISCEKADESDGPGGSGCTGQPVCQDVIDCPRLGGSVRFCFIGTCSCYYTAGGSTFSCPSCGDLTGCAQAALDACGS